MKILHVINGLNRAGAETVLYRLVAASGSEAEHVIVSLTGEGCIWPAAAAAGRRRSHSALSPRLAHPARVAPVMAINPGRQSPTSFKLGCTTPIWLAG